MKKLNKEQLKGLAQFLNGLSVAWFTGGVIAPFFSRQEGIVLTFTFAVYAIIVSIFLLYLTLTILRRVK